MFVPFILLILSAAALAASVLLPGYDPLILLALPCVIASLILLLMAWTRRAPRRPAARRAIWPKSATRPVRSKPVFRPIAPKPAGRSVVIDGSNVLHWKDGTPQIAAVRQVVDLLTAQGFSPGVVFDANAGYKISDRYHDDREMAELLGLPEDRVLVVPRGTQADPVLLATARNLGAPIVTNDRYRDWAEAHPEVRNPGHLIQGGYKAGRIWLDKIKPL